MKSLKGKTLLAAAAAVLLTFFGSWLLMSRIVEDHIADEAVRELSRQAGLVARLVEESDGSLDLEELAQELECRISLIDENGTVLRDTEASVERLDNHGNRPEIKRAFSSGAGSEIRYSRSLDSTMVYSARALSIDGNLHVVRLAYRLSALDQAAAEGRKRLFGLSILAALAVLALAQFMIRRFFRPLERIVAAADDIATGRESRFPIMADRELQSLSRALDDMSQQLHEAMEELRHERGDLETLIASMPVGLILLDRKKSIRMINHCARELLDLKTGVLLPGSLHPLIDRVAESGQTDPITLDLPERGLFLTVSAESIETGILLVFHDMTEEHRLDLARRNFIADASHEFQTPLTSIGVTAEFLMDEEDVDTRKRYLNSILEQQRRLTSLVDDMLLLSRLEAEPPKEKKEPLDLTEILSEVISEHRSHPMASKVEITLEAPEKAPMVGRRDELYRALGNLIGNGVKYVRRRFENEPGGKIAVELKEDGDLWTVTVSDNGVGIKESLASSIFERFQKGDPSRSRKSWGQGGYGLGLAIAKRIVEGHDGRIDLTRFVDGATFEVSLPKCR